MGIVLPQLAPASEDRVSGAQVIDGCLRFDESKGQYLKFTPSSSGNRRTQTLSVWIKNTYTGGNNKVILGAGDNPSQSRHNIYYTPTKRFGITQNPTGSQNDAAVSVGVFKDYSGWQHLVMQLDCTVGQNSGQVRIWVNGVPQENGDYNGGGSAAYITDQDGIFNTINKRMYLGHYAANPGDPAEFDGYMAQYYWIDGLALGPGYFGYVDPLTNTWRPKKFKVEGTTDNNGTNWSSNFTGSHDSSNGWGTTYQASNVFDGNLQTAAIGDENATGLTWTAPGGGIGADAETIRIFGNNDACPDTYLKINGIDYGHKITSGFGPDWTTLKGPGAVGGGIEKLETVYLRDNDAGNTHYRWRALEIDGVILKDSTTQTLDFGTNGVYLPFDGNTPIGQDQSGKGNDYTPVNFGGSNILEKATGAKPILNTVGGTLTKPGVFGSDVGNHYTILNTSGGGLYRFDGITETNPPLSFVRGATYIFDYSATGGSHPLAFSSTAIAGGITSYTDGVNTATSNVTKITVPHDAPDTLYYYCTSHTNMNNAITVTTDESKADLYASSCIFAAPFTSNSRDVSDQINCNSAQKANSSTDSGVTYNSTFTSPNFYNSYGVYAPGGGTSQKVVYSDNDDFNLDGPFTIEFFLKMNSDTDCTIICDDGVNGDPQIKYTTTNDRIQLQSSDVNIELDETYNTGLQFEDGDWHHVAFVRSAVDDTNAIYLFIDGVAQILRARQNSANSSVNFNQMALFTGAVGRFPGYLQDLRIYKGIAKYTSNFVPASPDPDILPDTPSGVATKSKLTKITNGAAAFGNANGYLSLPNSTDVNFGSGEFTWECFAYFTSVSGSVSVMGQWENGSNRRSWLIQVNDGKLQSYVSSSGSSGSDAKQADSPANYLHANRWYHIAVARSGNNMRLFIDGKLLTTTDLTGFSVYANTDDAFQIGAQNTGGSHKMKGFLSNVRIVKGQALYTKDFDVPTEPLTTTSQGATASNVKLLCCQSNTQVGGAVTAPNMGGVNDGTQWSSGAGLNFEAVNPARDGFNGVANSNTRTNTGDVIATVEFPTPAAFSSSLKVRGARDSGDGLIELTGANGTIDVSSQFTSSNANLETITITGVTSPLTAITLTGNSSSQPRFSAIYVDDVMLVDPASPQGDATAVTFNPFITDVDAIHGQEGTFATLNPIDTNFGTNLKDGNLKAVGSSNWGAGHARGNIALTSGKWFWESTWVAGSSTLQFGFANRSASLSESYGTTPANSWTFYFPNSSIITPSGGVSSGSYVSNTTAALGDVIGCALDMDNGTWQFFKNGTPGPVYGLNDTKSSSTVNTTELYPWVGSYNGTQELNFGQKPFKFSPPDGFQPITASAARPDTVIPDPDQYVKAVQYRGTGGNLNIDVGFKPDFSYFANRTGNGYIKYLFDSVRGETKALATSGSQGSNSEATIAEGLKSFNSNGVTIGNNGQMNESDAHTWISWHWKAGGGKSGGGGFFKDDVEYADAAALGMNVGGQDNRHYFVADWESTFPTANGSGVGTPYNLFRGGGNELKSGAFTNRWDLSSYNITCDKVTIKGEYRQGIFYKVIGSGGTTIFNSQIGNGHHILTATNVGTLKSIIFGTASGTSSSWGMIEIKIDGRRLIQTGQLSTVADAPTDAPIACSIGTKQGFSILKWTGGGASTTLAHGLTKAPQFIMVKHLANNSTNWIVYHHKLDDATKYLRLNSSATQQTQVAAWDSLHPTQACIHLGAEVEANHDGQPMVAYCWHDVPGLQKFGIWTNNNSNDGTFIELGFKPAIVLLKDIDGGENWYIIDSVRHTFNKVAPSSDQANAVNTLNPDTNHHETNSRGGHTNTTVDFLSNGFKIRSTNTGAGEISFGTRNYVYAAWAEAPQFNLYGASSSAR